MKALLRAALALAVIGCGGLSSAESVWCDSHPGQVISAVDVSTMSADAARDFNTAQYEAFLDEVDGASQEDGERDIAVVLKAHGAWDAPCKRAYASR